VCSWLHEVDRYREKRSPCICDREKKSPSVARGSSATAEWQPRLTPPPPRPLTHKPFPPFGGASAAQGALSLLPCGFDGRMIPFASRLKRGVCPFPCGFDRPGPSGGWGSATLPHPVLSPPPPPLVGPPAPLRRVAYLRRPDQPATLAAGEGGGRSRPQPACGPTSAGEPLVMPSAEKPSAEKPRASRKNQPRKPILMPSGDERNTQPDCHQESCFCRV